MHLTLEVKRYHEFFWLHDIQEVNIQECCMKCFIGETDDRVYFETLHQSNANIDIEIREQPNAVAYYLCGLSEGFNWYQNTHVAFVPAQREKVFLDNANIKLTITDAKQINFADYKPNPKGHFTRRQRTCRNWIFANYIKDGMLRR